MHSDTSPSPRVDCSLWNVVPLLFNGCAKLLDIGGNWNTLSYTSIQRIPKCLIGHWDLVSELHGNMFVEECGKCNRCVVSAGKKVIGVMGNTIMHMGWLVAGNDYGRADLALSLVKPRGDLPLLTKRKGGKVVIVNLQPTKQVSHRHMRFTCTCVNGYMDEVMNQLMELLGMDIPKEGPTFCESFTSDQKPLPAIAAQKEVKGGEETGLKGRKRLAEPKKKEDENDLQACNKPCTTVAL
uniref:Deacetylase sirtuin-type domain-containing protein n=1 Tax=Oncorhynchus tshawytscha TaxID=74940 RepID=A0AAZ3NWV6_ONCTS